MQYGSHKLQEPTITNVADIFASKALLWKQSMSEM